MNLNFKYKLKSFIESFEENANILSFEEFKELWFSKINCREHLFNLSDS